MNQRHCLLMATFNMDVRAWSGVIWEFADVISRIESADIVAPGNRFFDKDNPSATPPLRERLDAKLRRMTGRHVARMPVVTLERDYDLAIYICQFIHEVEELVQIRDWRSRAKKAVIYLLETWPATFPKEAHTLAKLDMFDHVFVLNGSSIRELERYTSTPISQLSTATDVMRTTPVPDYPRRVVDLCCIGRNNPEVHSELLALARRQGMFYHYDVWKNQNVGESWEAVRQWNAELIRRSKYYLVWDPGHRTAGNRHACNMQVLSTRYFEGAAGGAVLIGSAPDCPEFRAAFNWPDAVITLGDDPVSAVRMLEEDPARVSCIRIQNITHSLRRHDWAHRWRQVLHVLGLAPTTKHITREKALEARALKVDLQQPHIRAVN
jgi:hypothetical protein